MMLLNKIELNKARKTGLLCLSVMSFASVAVLSFDAQAQNAPVYAQPSQVQAAAQMEIRLQEMENQVRQLTGKVETQVYEINSLRNKVKRLEGDLMAVSGLGDVAPAAAPNQQPRARINPAPTPQANPLGIDLSATDPKPMQSKTVIGGNSNDPTAQYEAAYTDLKNSKYEEAESGFKSFLANHGDNVLAANAKYWLGETHYVRGNYKTAAREFAEGFQTFPNSAKSPDILLKLGMSLSGMGKNDQACVALGQVPVKFPIGHDDIIEQAKTQRAKLSCAG